ncbi:MAG TPA: helix-turn-helix domain-containing protein [Candidatus Aphodomonas merdavium]|nr:helix-turn-helix domain-containing protein [Candidatus Aphodomonas merdavium]
MSYQHLTLEERYCLAEFRENGLSIRAIARIRPLTNPCVQA